MVAEAPYQENKSRMNTSIGVGVQSNHAFESGRAEERRVLGLRLSRRAAQRER